MAMSPATETAPSTTGTTGAARVRKIFCLIYGILAVVLGVLSAAIAALVTWAHSSGRLQDLLGIPADSISPLLGPFGVAYSLIGVVLGVLIIRQSVTAAILLLAFTVLTDVLSYFVPALNFSALNGEPPGFGIADAITYAIMLALTAVIVIADRSARGAEARR
jgi:hypothetical protein